MGMKTKRVMNLMMKKWKRIAKKFYAKLTHIKNNGIIVDRDRARFLQREITNDILVTILNNFSFDL